MTKDALWQEIIKQNPDWDGPEVIKMIPKGMRKFYELIYNQAHHAGFENGKAHAGKTTANEPSAFDKIFGNAFGQKGH